MGSTNDGRIGVNPWKVDYETSRAGKGPSGRFTFRFNPSRVVVMGGRRTVGFTHG